jgi:hypothetical protein
VVYQYSALAGQPALAGWQWGSLVRPAEQQVGTHDRRSRLAVRAWASREQCQSRTHPCLITCMILLSFLPRTQPRTGHRTCAMRCCTPHLVSWPLVTVPHAPPPAAAVAKLLLRIYHPQHLLRHFYKMLFLLKKIHIQTAGSSPFRPSAIDWAGLYCPLVVPGFRGLSSTDSLLLQGNPSPFSKPNNSTDFFQQQP